MNIIVKINSNRLPDLAQRLPAACRDAVATTVYAVEGEAKNGAPVDTGALRNSIQGQMVGHDKGIVATDIEYAPYQEFGTSRGVPAKLFMTRAALNQRGPFIERIKAALAGI